MGMAETQTMMLQEFSARVATWEQGLPGSNRDASTSQTSSNGRRSESFCGLPFDGLRASRSRRLGMNSQGAANTTASMMGSAFLVPYGLFLYATALGISVSTRTRPPLYIRT